MCDEPLHLAIKNGHFGAAQLLLERGANVNARYFFGCEINLISPLNTLAMRMLLTYGADPDSRDRNGLTPLMKACRLPQVTGNTSGYVTLRYFRLPYVTLEYLRLP